VIIAKHRNGSIGSVALKFIGKFTKFGDLDQGFGDNPFAGGGGLPPSDFDDPFGGSVRLPSKMNGDGLPKSNFETEEPPF
jgi:replicative DNA helicase